MTNLIVKAGIAVLIALTGLSATAPTAIAAGPEFGIQVQQVQFRDRDRRWRPPGCSLAMAERRASRMGLRRARVVDVSRRTVTVAGFGRRGRDRVVFANVRGCPLIRR